MRKEQQPQHRAAPDVTKYFPNRYEHKRSYLGGFLGVMLIVMGVSSATILPALFPVGILMVVFGIAIAAVSLMKTEHQLRGIVETKEIYSLKNHSGISGSFLLGVGSIDNTEEYLYFRKGDHGGLVRESLSCEDVELIMTDTVIPSIKTIIVPDGNPNSEETAWEERTFLFCPTKTVQRRFKIN